MFKFEASRIRKLEQDLPKWARCVSLVSFAEARLYDSIAGKGAATIATNGVDLEYFKPVPTEEKMACAFVGALDYLPNVDASVWFAREIWPEVRKQIPDAEFWLIGRKPAPAVQKLVELPGVKLIGQVPDVRPHVLAAAVAVVPMRLSRGLQNKVLEAMAMGKATIAAAPALAALSAVPGRDLLRANTNEEWVSMIVTLLRDPERRRELGHNAREFVEQNHNWEKCLKPLTVPISQLSEIDTANNHDAMQEDGCQKEIVSR